MPTTIYNIDRIRERVPEKSREDIRDALNEVQLIVYSQNCLQTQKISATAMPPYLVTAAGVFEYDCPADCRETAAVFSLQSSSLHSVVGRLIEPYGTYKYNNKEYVKIPVNTRNATYGELAKVYFKNDPGTTTDVYFHLYYIKATEISSEDIQLTIPEEQHWRLRQAVISMFTTEDYGNSPQDESIIERVARKIRNSLNKGYQSNVGITDIQEEYREDFTRRYGHR